MQSPGSDFPLQLEEVQASSLDPFRRPQKDLAVVNPGSLYYNRYRRRPQADLAMMNPSEFQVKEANAFPVLR